MRWRRWKTMRQPNGSDAGTEPPPAARICLIYAHGHAGWTQDSSAVFAAGQDARRVHVGMGSAESYRDNPGGAGIPSRKQRKLSSRREMMWRGATAFRRGMAVKRGRPLG